MKEVRREQEMFCLDDILTRAASIGIAGHVRPDGDCVGAAMSLYLYIRTYFPEIRCEVRLEPFSDTFLFLQGTDEVIFTPTETEDTTPARMETQYDVFFCLDCGDADRLGKNKIFYEQAKKRVLVDHHISNQAFADVNYVVPDASSTCELLCLLYGEEKITREIAEALYLGIVHDTGVFQHSCTSAMTMRLAGMLMEKGIGYSRIIADTFYAKTYLQNQILGRALLESIRVLDGKIIFSALRLKDLKFYGVTSADLDGIVSQLKLTRGTEAAIFIHESTPGVFRVSMRSSPKIDVSAIASYYGGGGHKQAAGCTMRGQVYDVVNNLTALMEQQLGDA